MRRLMLVLAAVVLHLTATNTRAAELWSPIVRVTAAYPHSGGFIIYTEYVNAAFSTCGGNRYAVSLGNPNYKAMVATLLVAVSAGRSIQMHFETDAPSCDPVFDRFIMV